MMRTQRIPAWRPVAAGWLLAALVAPAQPGRTGPADNPAASPASSLATGLAASPAPVEVPEKVAECLECHEDQSATMDLGDGTTLNIGIEAQSFLTSVHGRQLSCTDCHDKYDADHPEGREFPNRRAYRVAAYETCKRCHFDTYNRTIEGVHYAKLKDGSNGVPVCTDCHGSHDIKDPHSKRAMVAKSCGSCHDDIFDEYKRSVHGAALIADNNDVPACADCHTAHRILEPGKAGFHAKSPDMCIRCHADDKLMKRYGLPSTVASTYLADFHGVTASLSDPKTLTDDKLTVVCVDCHGYHGIGKASGEAAAAMKERVGPVCAGCHKEAPSQFSATWLSHYPPSLDNAPLVFLVDLFYRIFIPFMVLGLALQVGLHLYRVGIRR